MKKYFFRDWRPFTDEINRAIAKNELEEWKNKLMSDMVDFIYIEEQYIEKCIYEDLSGQPSDIKSLAIKMCFCGPEDYDFTKYHLNLRPIG